MNICVFGASSSITKDFYIKKVEELGERLAKRGHGLVFGAGGNGLMGAAARGFSRGRGRVVGIVPRFFEDEVKAKFSDCCDELIFTETMAQRKTMMEDSSDAFVVVPGGIGTFEEFFEVLTLRQLGRHKKAIAIFNINGYFDQLTQLLEKSVEEGFLSAHCMELIFISDDCDAIADYIDEYDGDKADSTVSRFRY